MTKQPTEADLRRWCRQWQRRLRLGLWRIKIKFARSREMTNGDGSISWGQAQTLEEHGEARVKILDPDDYKDNQGRREIEETLVHELLHVLWQPVLRDDKPGANQAKDIAIEQAINILASLLVAQQRQSEAK
jgi:hypothetical protein